MSKIIRVFPRRTSLTPRDDYAFVGDPPMIRPKFDEVHVSVTFTWDIKEGKRLQQAWQPYYSAVKIGGPACGSEVNEFIPGRYLRQGVTFTSRGCNNKCSFCLVSSREGRLKELKDFPTGHIIQDNNLLQCSRGHLDRVFAMLQSQRAIQFSGGLDTRLITGRIADDLRGLRICQLFLACDTDQSLKPLKRAVKKLSAFPRDKLRCYVMIGYQGESVKQAEDRLEAVWDAGCLPFSQLYQPPEKYIEYPIEWTKLNWKWSRPAAMKAIHKVYTPKPTIKI